jgi:quercetin dioxygenase-like cupin family protein
MVSALEVGMQAQSFRIAYVALVLFGSAASGEAEPLAVARFPPDEIVWSRTVIGGLRAILAGDDQKPGMYAYRTYIPANTKIQPHFHPDEKVVTIISGTLLMGYGEQFDETLMKRLPPGSVWTEPARQPHFVWAKDGDVLIQVVGANGPTGTMRIDSK